MLTRPQVQRYASQSGLRDIMIAEKEIVLTFVLQLFGEKGLLDKLAFKGGTCLRKMILGSQGRFSTDLDFTALEGYDAAEVILDMLIALEEEPFHGVTFQFDDDSYYETQDGLSLGGNPTYKHDWNEGGESEIKLQISSRETPTLPTERLEQSKQSYFSDLPFTPITITCLAFEEIISEKIRACYQRNKVRDIYDLGVFATRPLNQSLVRRLVVLKLWQADDAFDPSKLMEKFEDGSDFDWGDLDQLVRKDQNIDQKKIITACTKGFGYLSDMTEDEATLAADAHQREYALWKKLRADLPE